MKIVLRSICWTILGVTLPSTAVLPFMTQRDYVICFVCCFFANWVGWFEGRGLQAFQQRISEEEKESRL